MLRKLVKFLKFSSFLFRWKLLLSALPQFLQINTVFHHLCHLYFLWFCQPMQFFTFQWFMFPLFIYFLTCLIHYLTQDKVFLHTYNDCFTRPFADQSSKILERAHILHALFYVQSSRTWEIVFFCVQPTPLKSRFIKGSHHQVWKIIRSGKITAFLKDAYTHFIFFIPFLGHFQYV